MRAGDIITRIDGKSVSDMSLNAAVKLMRGDPNTKIDLIVARKGANKPLAFSLTRALIKTQSVKMKKLDGNVGYIRISQFQERTAEDLSKYLDELAEDGHLAGLVLDLRNDPGGLLQAAIGVSAAFLPKGSDVVSTKGRQAHSDYTFKAIESDYRAGNAVKALSTLTPTAKSVPIVVLINSSSASASEIVAGALQDHKRATIMGDRSFGKGSVQTIMPMKFGDKTVAVKLTTARYYTPSGRSIQAKGIIPTSMWTTPRRATTLPSRFANPTLPITFSIRTTKRMRRSCSRIFLMMMKKGKFRTISTCSATTRTGSFNKPSTSSKRSLFLSPNIAASHAMWSRSSRPRRQLPSLKPTVPRPPSPSRLRTNTLFHGTTAREFILGPLFYSPFSFWLKVSKRVPYRRCT